MRQPWQTRRSFFHPGIRAVVCGLTVLVFLVIIDQISIYYGLRQSQLVLDDICGAIIVGLLVYRHESVRSKYLSEKLKTIEMMNHHVRNALEVIVDSAYLHGHREQLEQIRDSVRRIDWALREILPGRVLDQYYEPGKSPAEPSEGRSAPGRA